MMVSRSNFLRSSWFVVIGKLARAKIQVRDNLVSQGLILVWAHDDQGWCPTM